MNQKTERPGTVLAVAEARGVSSRQATPFQYLRKALGTTGGLVLRNIVGEHGEHQGFEVAR